MVAHPVAGFGLVLIAFLWIATWHQIKSELEANERNLAQDLANLALVVEQNAAKVIDEGDRTLHFLRDSYERNGFVFDWQYFEREEGRLSAQIAFIAALDDKGEVIYSSGFGTARRPFNLGDRDYFRVHMNARTDKLFTSQTVRSKKDGAWLFFMSRRFNKADGSFGGALVVCVDPARLAQSYRGLKLGEGSGVAIVGVDGLVRAGSGVFADDVGLGFKEGVRTGGTDNFDAGTGLVRETFKGQQRTIVYRPIGEHPLLAMVMSSGNQYVAGWERSRRNYLGNAVALSMLVVFAVYASLRKHRRQEREIRRLILHDNLTEIANRAGFTETLERCYARLEAGDTFGLHLVDLDGFKGVNDTHGHPVGDKLLQSVAERLRAALGEADLLARLGGDEFAVIQHDPRSLQDVREFADRMCRLMAEKFEIAGLTLQIGASIGVALGERDPLGASEIVRRADTALYNAKATGRGGYCVYSREFDVAARAERIMEAELRAAVGAGQLVLHYQPIVDISTGRPTGYEALLRWHHPERGMVSPADFVPLAEKTGSIVEIGRWVVEQACRDIVSLPECVRVSVNVSPVQLKTGTLVSIVEGALCASQLEPGRLMIEITETAMLENSESNLRQLQALKALGVRLAVDDFGAGYSSINYLQTFPIDCIKIDRSFVRDLGSCPKADVFVKAINQLARDLCMSTIAEGVETTAQRDALIALGSTEAQGFLFGRGMPILNVVASHMADADARRVAAAPALKHAAEA